MHLPALYKINMVPVSELERRTKILFIYLFLYYALPFKMTFLGVTQLRPWFELGFDHWGTI